MMKKNAIVNDVIIKVFWNKGKKRIIINIIIKKINDDDDSELEKKASFII